MSMLVDLFTLNKKIKAKRLDRRLGLEAKIRQIQELRLVRPHHEHKQLIDDHLIQLETTYKKLTGNYYLVDIDKMREELYNRNI